jgi:hypothetical protein
MSVVVAPGCEHLGDTELLELGDVGLRDDAAAAKTTMSLASRSSSRRRDLANKVMWATGQDRETNGCPRPPGWQLRPICSGVWCRPV